MLSCVSPENYEKNMKEIKDLNVPFGFKLNGFMTTKPKNGYTSSFFKNSGNIYYNDLGAEPVKKIMNHFGEWTLIFICLTLAMSPLKRFTSLAFWTKFRRMLGLFVFFYATIHLLTYIGLDKYVVKAASEGLAVILITHNVHHAYPVGNSFTVLNRGRSLGTFNKKDISREELLGMMAGGEELDKLEVELKEMGRLNS